MDAHCKHDADNGRRVQLHRCRWLWKRLLATCRLLAAADELGWWICHQPHRRILLGHITQVQCLQRHIPADDFAKPR